MLPGFLYGLTSLRLLQHVGPLCRLRLLVRVVRTHGSRRSEKDSLEEDLESRRRFCVVVSQVDEPNADEGGRAVRRRNLSIQEGDERHARAKRVPQNDLRGESWRRLFDPDAVSEKSESGVIGDNEERL